MKNLLKAVFSKKDEVDSRTLNHPRDLNTGDIIKFQYLPQIDLSNKQFEISNINTYDFEDRNLTEFTLSGDNKDPIYLIINETDDEPFLSLSRKIQRPDVEKLFDLDEFSELFDNENHSLLNRLSEPENLENWTSNQYRQEIFAEGGYFHKGDYRNKNIPEDESAGDDFEYYLAIDDTRKYTVEAEVYDDGETDVIITLRLPLTSIEEMWASASQT